MHRRRIALLMVGSFVAAAQAPKEDAWSKVQALKSGTEIRVLKKGTAQPLVARFDEATDDLLRIVVKNEQMAIPKDQLLRIDHRPSSSRVSRQTTTSTNTVDPEAARPKPGPQRTPGPSGSSSSSLSIGRADFEVLWRRSGQ